MIYYRKTLKDWFSWLTGRESIFPDTIATYTETDISALFSLEVRDLFENFIENPSASTAQWQKMLAFHAFPRMWDGVVVAGLAIDGGFSDDEITSAIKSAYSSFGRRIGAYILNTKDYYETLLNLYDSEKSKLMDDIKSKTGYSTMPQSTNMTELGSTKDDLESATIQYTELASKMARLDEIQSAYRNLMREWANEFVRTFELHIAPACYDEGEDE